MFMGLIGFDWVFPMFHPVESGFIGHRFSLVFVHVVGFDRDYLR